MTNEDRYHLARFTTPEEDTESLGGVILFWAVLGLVLAIVAAVEVFA